MENLILVDETFETTEHATVLSLVQTKVGFGNPCGAGEVV